MALGEPGPLQVRHAEQAIVDALANAGRPLTINDLKEVMPSTAVATINRALKALVPLKVARAGTGKRGDGYTYTLKSEVSSQPSM